MFSKLSTRHLLALAIGLTLAAAIGNHTAYASTFRVGITNAAPLGATDVQALGVDIQRQDVTWNGESSYDGHLDFAPGIDTVVAVYGRGWNVPQTQAEIDSYCGFVGSILDRFPQVRGIVVWNEPDGKVGQSYFWPVGLSYATYGAILKTCSPVIRSRGALVIGPGLHPWLSDVDALIAAIPLGLLDVFDVHMYGWQNDNEFPPVLAKVRARFGKIPVWITEAGVESASIGEAAQAAAVSTQMVRAYCDGASAWFNFLLWDEPQADRMQTGLMRSDGTPKPSYRAFTVTAAQIQAGAVNCDQPEVKNLWAPDQLLAQRLGEIGGWTRDAYER